MKNARKQAKQGGKNEKYNKKKPKWWGRKKKTKKGIFTKWQPNLLMPMEFFLQYH